MYTPEAPLNILSALLNAQSRPPVLAALAAMVTTSGSCIETTFERTNRVYDQYFAPSK